jgi:predicted transcriptional regulator
MIFDQSRRLLVSLKPPFANAILNGTKSIELRRVRPRIEIPTEALLYASSPTCAFVGICQVVDVLDYSPRGLWRLHGAKCGISHRDFSEYFDGSERAYGLVIANPERLSRPVSLGEIRSAWIGFQPPQSFRYLTLSRSDEVIALAG